MRNYSVHGRPIVGFLLSCCSAYSYILPTGLLSLRGTTSTRWLDNLYTQFKYDSLYHKCYLRRTSQYNISDSTPLNYSLSFDDDAIMLKINMSVSHKPGLNRHNIASKNPDMINLFKASGSIQHFCNLETTKPNKNYE